MDYFGRHRNRSLGLGRDSQDESCGPFDCSILRWVGRGWSSIYSDDTSGGSLSHEPW